jgi:ATP adenylyltransferase
MAIFQPGTLWNAIQQTSATALHSGALQPIPTQFETVPDAGIQFLVRIVDNLARKQRQRPPKRTAGASGSDPFLPYDQDMFVADASQMHVCLLNKFNVIDHHLLIVTRQFEDQQQRLRLQDFTALWRCMAEFPALAFYNAGSVAGASQPHKHLQMVPLTPTTPPIPIEPLIEALPASQQIGDTPALPFLHAVAQLPTGITDSPDRAARLTRQLYDQLLQHVGLTSTSPEREHVTAAYNLLITRRWMMLVPRSREAFHGISINALGFAGALLVKDRQQYEILRRHGPLSALQHVAQPALLGPGTASTGDQA